MGAVSDTVTGGAIHPLRQWYLREACSPRNRPTGVLIHEGCLHLRDGYGRHL